MKDSAKIEMLSNALKKVQHALAHYRDNLPITMESGREITLEEVQYYYCDPILEMLEKEDKK